MAYLSAFKLAQGDGGVVCPTVDSPTLHCAVTERHGTKTNGCPVEGRRPAGLVDPDAHDDDGSLGAYFAACERLEAASVFSFRELAADLVRLGAPGALVAACEGAALDEIRH